MCKICIDWHLGKLTIDEAFRNLSEFKETGIKTEQDDDHYWEMAEMLSEDEYETY